jgi:hypothetical protein
MARFMRAIQFFITVTAERNWMARPSSRKRGPGHDELELVRRLGREVRRKAPRAA